MSTKDKQERTDSGPATGLAHLLPWIVGAVVLGAGSLMAVRTLAQAQSDLPALVLAVVFLAGAAGGVLCVRGLSRTLTSTRRILGALRDIERGQLSVDALTVTDDATAETRGWNRLLTEYHQVRRGQILGTAREALQQRRVGTSELEGVCDAISEGLLLVNEQRQVRFANGAAAVYLDAERSSIVGADLTTVIEHEEVLEAIEAVVGGKGSPRMGIEVKRNDDEGVLRFSIRPVRREDNAAAMVIIEDVTQKKVSDDARNSFLAQATHELRAPLTNIRLYVETAIDEGAEDKALQGRCLNVINDEALRLERVVSDILSVSEIEAGSLCLKQDDVPIQTIVQELRDHYQAQAEQKNVTLTFDLPPKLPVLRGDRDKILVALHNLLSNALKYTEEGGQITVRAEWGAGLFRVEVSDTGIGMNEQDAAKIFEKFYRAKDERINRITGSGLGLSLAREVIRLHGGDITVESKLNEGSTFALTLPAPNEAA
jgi:signal transduction histidine kinase